MCVFKNPFTVCWIFCWLSLAVNLPLKRGIMGQLYLNIVFCGKYRSLMSVNFINVSLFIAVYF